MPNKKMIYARLRFYPSGYQYCVFGPPGKDVRNWGGQFCLGTNEQGNPQYYEFIESKMRFNGCSAVYEWVPVEASRVRALRG